MTFTTKAPPKHPIVNVSARHNEGLRIINYFKRAVEHNWSLLCPVLAGDCENITFMMSEIDDAI